jgi:IPT/TIG domain
MYRLLAIALLASVSTASAATFPVTSTATSGPTSLNQAIIDAAASPGVDQILFNIPPSDPNCDGNGVCTISPPANLPSLPDEVTIDGYSQPGAQVNTADQGSNAVIKIVLSGSSNSDPGTTGLELAGDNSVVRGLAIGGFQYGIRVPFSSGNKILGCFIGTDASGLAASPNQWGISVLLDSNLQIGSMDPADRMVVSGNTTAGIDLYGPLNDLILGSLVGPDKTGLSALPNTQGIYASSAGPANLTIGDNVISGNSQNGVFIGLASGSAVTMQGNLVGTDAFGILPLPNTFAGIRIASSGVTALIGGILPGEGNVIAYNLSRGVGVDSSASGVTIRGNSIYENGLGAFGYAIGIDLEPFSSTTANDEGDEDDGANGLQNFPIVSEASALPGGGTEVQGVLHSTANGEYDLDFYENGACLPPSQSFLQGRTYIGTTHVTADATGTATFDATLAATIAVGSHVSATATDSQGNTSEFSQRLPWFVNPNFGPASAGTAIGVGGTDFQPGATATVGGVPATNVNVNSWTSLTATTPELSPGTLNDIVVTDPDGASGTLEGGFATDFLDVPPSHLFYQFVTGLVLNRVTVGLGGGYYGVDMPVSRQQMAVFLEKSKRGPCYVPPACTVQVFSDVPCSSGFAPWINQLAADGVTGGCGGGNYCPTNPVRRDQMAPFLLKANYGFGYLPPPCQGVFADVPCPSTFADWIEELSAENITAGCGGGNYCPSANNTRGQMAVFLVKVFFEF